MEPDRDTAVGWADHFLDHAASLPKGLHGELDAAPADGSFARDAVLAVGGFPEGLAGSGAGALGDLLMVLGHRAWRASLATRRGTEHRGWLALVADQHARGRDLARLVERQRLRLMADEVRGRDEEIARLSAWRWALGYGPARQRSISRHVAHAAPEVAAEYRAARPMVAVGVASAWAGVLRERVSTAAVFGSFRVARALDRRSS